VGQRAREAWVEPEAFSCGMHPFIWSESGQRASKSCSRRLRTRLSRGRMSSMACMRTILPVSQRRPERRVCNAFS
jgi:hypothetical protein